MEEDIQKIQNIITSLMSVFCAFLYFVGALRETNPFYMLMHLIVCLGCATICKILVPENEDEKRY